MSKYGGRWRSAAALVCTTAALGFVSGEAQAFELKETKTGQVVRWTAASATFVIDPSVDQAIPGGARAVGDALEAWSGVSGAPVLSSVVGPGGAKPAFDGQNSVVFAPKQFAPAGAALAVTVLVYDETTGGILDADIVINGEYRFGVLAAGAKAAAGTQPMSTDGASGGGDDASRRFDLQHVVSHEVGHSLGLGDVHDGQTAVMYAYSMPGDASFRAPTADDADGLEAAYGGSERRAGCGQSSVAGARARPRDAWVALALVLGGCAWMASRRRVRIAVPVAAALVSLLANAGPARSASRGRAPVSDATAVVTGVTTREAEGVLQSTVELVTDACHARSCPTASRAKVWGGTLGGITQQVGELPAPPVGGRIEVVFPPHAVDAAEAADTADEMPVAVVAQRRP
jgi:hypothetical protein